MPTAINLWVNHVTDEFSHTFRIDLWKKFPAEQVADLENEVHDKDSFKSRLASLTALFDNLNKKVFDKATKERTEGSRLSLTVYLKHQLQDYHPLIDDTLETIQMVSLLRAHFIHTGNVNYKEAFKYFNLTEPLTDYKIAWASIILKFELFLSDFARLMRYKKVIPLKNAVLSGETIERAFLNTLKGHTRYLKEQPLAKIILKEIALHGELTDLAVAKNTGHQVKKIRKILLPFTASFLRVSYATDNSTLIRMPKFREEIKNIDYWLNQTYEN